MSENNTCPIHNERLVGCNTQYGRRFGCPVDGCTVVRWDGSTSTPADQNTRTLRNQCHRTFDPLWYRKGGPFARQDQGRSSRRRIAYAWLAETLGIERDAAHFGMFDAEQCRVALDAMRTLVEETVGGKSP